MFRILILTVSLALVVSATTTADADAQIVSQVADIDEHGFKYSYETSNNIAAEASQHGNEAVTGSVQWTADDGTPIKLVYTADETGYHPQGDVLPTPPPTPEAILKALEYIASHPPAPENGH